ncbi:hypothetical protein [Corynebacterium sp.]|uniref:hypothetical protein n=1 Tax=Corynebacterium sp. TaxID=1720 RepID=UPI0028A8B9F8|nr:hypothetical protein [Corynebacterium sp.]
MWAKTYEWLAGKQAIIMVLGWAVWDAATAVAYLDTSPPQLQTVESILHIPIWVVWAAVTALLVVGAFIPVKRGERWLDVAVWLRGVGLFLTAALLGGWAVEFILADGRGWVSGKNYLFMSFLGLHYVWIVVRYSVREG